MKRLKNSEEIAGFLGFLKEVPYEYSASLHVQQSCEEDAQRLLSALERNKLDSESKERIEQKIIQALQDYRGAKERADRLRPVAEFLMKNMAAIVAIETCWKIYTG